MNNLQRVFQAIGSELALALEFDRSVTLKDCIRIVADVHLRDFGGPQGMLVFSTCENISSISKELISSGYGYTLMSIPTGRDVDMASYKEVLIDWGWSADVNRRPTWMG